MKKGIMVPFFTEISMNRRLDLIKKAGFDTFMLSLDKKHEKFTAPISEIVEHCNQIGLIIDCGHASYRDPELNEFWLNTALGDEIEQDYMEALKLANQYHIKNVVFHLHFETNYKLSEIGIERLKRMVSYAEKNHINIAVENLYSRDELEYIFSRIKSPNLGMCFDSGHENFLTQDAHFLFQFGNRLKALHLHDNNGIQDEHKTPFTGTINWNEIALGLAKANQVSLESEVRIYRPEGKSVITEEELLASFRKEYEALEQLEKLIKASQNYKK